MGFIIRPYWEITVVEFQETHLLVLLANNI